MLVFDCETDGFLAVLTKIHCLSVREPGEPVTRYVGHEQIAVGLRRLMEATEQGTVIAGHNVIKFDVPALQKLFPWFKPVQRYVWDSMVLARLMYPDLREIDTRLKALGKLPPKLYKKHTLEAWGYRLGNYKGDFTGPWDTYTDVMGDYCDQDVEVTAELLRRLMTSKFYPGLDSVNLEMAVAWILARQERHGFLFDQQAAGELYKKLAKRRIELEAELAKVFKPFYMAGAYRVPKKTVRTQVEELGENPKAPIYQGKGKARVITGYKFRTMDTEAGAAYQAVKLTTFNPASRDHVANRLTKLYGWKPEEFTDEGKPKVDETVLHGLPYPEAKPLEEFYLVLKRIGQLAEGKEAWMKHVQADGRIHGAVNTNGAVTGRMTHAFPNVSQVPATRSAYGSECRALFIVPLDKEIVGADADALELRCLAHYMARYDDGAYVSAVNLGKKEEGNDAHSVNARAIGLDPKELIHGKETGRDITKTWFYAFIYGAGDGKLGFILLQVKGRKAVKRGKESRAALAQNLPALSKLVAAVKAAAKRGGGYIRGLDGRFLRIRSEHSALNTLLQSAGALLMKRALVILDTNLQKEGYVPGVNYEFVANVHDEWQIECDIGLGETIGAMARDAIRLAGESFNFRCPLTGAFSVGRNWADTH
jgi:DNA polymerase-1